MWEVRKDINNKNDHEPDAQPRPDITKNKYPPRGAFQRHLAGGMGGEKESRIVRWAFPGVISEGSFLKANTVNRSPKE